MARPGGRDHRLGDAVTEADHRIETVETESLDRGRKQRQVVAVVAARQRQVLDEGRVNRPLLDRRRHRAVDNVDVIPLRLVLGEHFLDDPLRVTAEKLDLHERIFLFERCFDWAHDLIDDQRRIPRQFAFLLGALDEDLLTVRAFHQGNFFDGCRAARFGNQDRRQHGQHFKISGEWPRC